MQEVNEGQEQNCVWLTVQPQAVHERLVMCMNPHWRDKLPAWDIHLTNGEIHKSVTRKEISVVLGKMFRLGKISLYDSYIDVVRSCHIDNYNRFFTCT